MVDSDDPQRRGDRPKSSGGLALSRCRLLGSGPVRLAADAETPRLQKKFNVDEWDNGMERLITSTRRQNFLIPPRRHRAFPFAELGGRG